MSSKTGKGKHKTKGTTVDLHTFLQEKQAAPEGFTVVSAPKLNWAEAMEDEEIDDKFTLDYKKEVPASKIILPTAPKAVRAPDVDLTKVPTKAPFKAYLGNLPYEITEDDIVRFFRKLQVKDVQLPRDGGERGRLRGFGYAEFFDRDTLIEALSLNNETLKNRPIRVSLSSVDNDTERPKREERDDRTAGDWRNAPREQLPPRENRDQRYGRDLRNGNEYSDRDGFKSSGFDRRSNERGFDRGFSRNDRGFRDERDFDRGYNDRRNDRFERNDRYNSTTFERRPPPPPKSESPLPSEPSRDVPKERPKLQLKPRSIPVEDNSKPATPSAIFGGAKPVDTAQREREIEEKLRREEEKKDEKREDDDEKADRPVSQSPSDRVRRVSTNSNVSSHNRSRRGSESGPSSSSREDSDQKYSEGSRGRNEPSSRLFENRESKSRGRGDFVDNRDFGSRSARQDYESRANAEESRTNYDRDFRSRNRGSSDEDYSSNTYPRSGGGGGGGGGGGYRNGRNYGSSDRGYDGSQNRKPRSNYGNPSAPRSVYQPRRGFGSNDSRDSSAHQDRSVAREKVERQGPRFRPLGEGKESIEYTSQNKFTHLRTDLEDDDGASD